jgi:signal transduction histidine kinase
MRRLRVLLALLCLWGALGAWAQPLSQAWVASDDALAPPANDDPRWHAQALPHVWSLAEQRGRGVWYRLRFEAPVTQGEPWALYIPQAHVNAAVWLDGVSLGDGGAMTDPLAFHWNQPFLFPVPPLPAGSTHELLIKVRAAGGFGLLAPVELGAQRTLRERYELRRFWQAEVHGVLALLLVSIAVLGLGIWTQRRADSQYLWLAVSCGAWAGFALFLYGREFWIDPLWMQWIAQNGTVWWVTGLAHYVHRQTGVRRPRVERGLLVLSVLFGGVALSLDPLSRVHVYSLGHLFALATVSYLLVHTLRHWRRGRDATSLGLALACALVLVAGLHDVVLTMPVSWSSMELVRQLQAWRFYLTPFGAPVASLFLAAHLARRFVATLAQFEALNAELEQRVEDSRRALSLHYEARRRLELDQAATQERERIVREMHDGIGGQLMTALRGVERGAFSQDKVAELLQESLDDLRLIIDASAATRQLLPALAGWRSRWDPRLEALGIELRWRVDESVGEQTLTPTVVLQLMRILQEAVINTVKHARADTVHVDARVQDGQLHLDVVDNGCGLPAGGDLPGAGRHGLRSMQARAQAIGAMWSIGPAEGGGTAVRVRLQLAG